MRQAILGRGLAAVLALAAPVAAQDGSGAALLAGSMPRGPVTAAQPPHWSHRWASLP